jgi:hypothetical protein
MKFNVGYFFSIGGTSCGGTEDVEAADAESAVVAARALHPNAKLRIRTVRDENGEKYKVSAHDDPAND